MAILNSDRPFLTLSRIYKAKELVKEDDMEKALFVVLRAQKLENNEYKP